jgi:hypothetical protein
MRSAFPFLLIVLPSVFPVTLSAAAQTPAPSGPKDSFSVVVPKPTGKNGYEELVLAGDALGRSKAWATYQAAKPDAQSLSAKRRVLIDPQVQKALTLIRQGLGKPVYSPRAEVDFDTALPELAKMRDLSRLLSVVQYVQFSEGRIDDAIVTARTGLRMSQAIQFETLIQHLVGIATASIGIRGLADHLDQLSARQCEAVLQLCMEYVQRPGPLIAALEGERRGVKKSIQKMRQQGTRALLEAAGGADASDPNTPIPPELRAQAEALRAGGAPAVSRLFDQVEERLDRLHQQALERARKPIWQREPLEMPVGDSLPDRLAALLIPAVANLDQAFGREEASIRLLAVHALIRRYRWEYDRLPPSLEPLNLGQLALDPFTGKPLTYEVKGRTYRLYSEGPKATNPDDPRNVNGRLPVSIIPGDF